MKRLITLFFVMGILATFSLSAQYTGNSFYPDTAFIFPGDHMSPVFFDIGDYGVVCTYDNSSTHGSGGSDQRSSKMSGFFGEVYDDFGQYFLWNNGNKSTRMAPDTFALKYTVYFSEAGYYKAKNWNWNGDKKSEITLFSYPDLTPIDTILCDNGTKTGEYTPNASREWFLFDDDSLNVPEPGKYVMQIAVGGALSNSDGIGVFTFYTNNQYAAGDDVKFPTLAPSADPDTTWIYENDTLVINFSEAGELYILDGHRVNDHTRDDHKPITLGKALVFKNTAQAVTLGDNTIDFDGLGSGVKTLLVRNAGGINSLSYKLEIIDTTAPVLSLTSASSIKHGESFTANSNEDGKLVIVNDTVTQDMEVAALALVSQAITAGADSAISTATLTEGGDYKLYALDGYNNPSDPVAITITSPYFIITDFNNNQATDSVSADNGHVAGDIWVRNNDANILDLVDWTIIPADSAPEGYNLTDSVLMIDAGAYTNQFSLLMMELYDTIHYDTNFKYLHISYYMPKKSALVNNGAIRTWMKSDGSNGALEYKNASQKYYIAETGGWVDMVIDLTIATDNYKALDQGDTIDHFELGGFPENDTSYIGRISISKFAEPLFKNETDTVFAVQVNVSAEGTKVLKGDGTNVSASILPLNASIPGVNWSLENDETGASVNASGVFSSGNIGKVAVVGTAKDGSGKSGKVTIEVYVEDIILVDYNSNKVDNGKYSADTTFMAGDVWIRSGATDAADLFELEIVPADSAPAGYSLTDSVLKIDAGAYTGFFDLIMHELSDTVYYDSNFHYLHIAKYYPGKNTLLQAQSPFKTWLKKGGPSGDLVYKQASNDYYVTQPGGWTDLVLDMKLVTDNYTAPIHGDTIDHLEISGYTPDSISYLGSIVLSAYAEPRFKGMEDTVTVHKFNFSAENDTAIYDSTLALTVDGVFPVNAMYTEPTIAINENDSTGSSVDGMVFTAGKTTGKATVTATMPGTGAASKSVNIVVWDGTISIFNITRNVEFLMVPNPASNEVRISAENAGNASFSIYTTAGQLVISENFTSDNMMVDVSGLATGTYIVRIVNGNKVGTQKLIVE